MSNAKEPSSQEKAPKNIYTLLEVEESKEDMEIAPAEEYNPRKRHGIPMSLNGIKPTMVFTRTPAFPTNL
jgi:hypothetical protein